MKYSLFAFLKAALREGSDEDNIIVEQSEDLGRVSKIKQKCKAISDNRLE